MNKKEYDDLKTKLEELEEKETECYERARVLERMDRAGLLVKPTGIFFKNCPCGKKLNHKEMFGYHYYWCSCGYEYARVSAIG